MLDALVAAFPTSVSYFSGQGGAGVGNSGAEGDDAAHHHQPERHARGGTDSVSLPAVDGVGDSKSKSKSKAPLDFREGEEEGVETRTDSHPSSRVGVFSEQVGEGSEGAYGFMGHSRRGAPLFGLGDNRVFDGREGFGLDLNEGDVYFGDSHMWVRRDVGAVWKDGSVRRDAGQQPEEEEERWRELVPVHILDVYPNVRYALVWK